MMTTWIHERKDWPHFTWDSARLEPKLVDVRFRQKRLLGRMEALGFERKREASLDTLTTDVVKSSAIEGEFLNPDEVRSSITRRLGLECGGLSLTSGNVEGIVELMIDATQRFETLLTADRLFGWHAALFSPGCSGAEKITVGAWRPVSAGPMQVISGQVGRPKVHFQAPDASRLDAEMADFLAWFERCDGVDPVLRAGLAHLWFVTIHPFEDGNGRIARAVADMMLARGNGSCERYYSMSAQIAADRKAYYTVLECQQRAGVDVTVWLEWFLDCMGRAIDNAEGTLDAVLHKARVWERANQQPMTEHQRLVLNRMLDGFKGHMKSPKYAKIAKCSEDTALQEIRELSERGVFVENAGNGRTKSYRLVNPEEIQRGGGDT